MDAHIRIVGSGIRGNRPGLGFLFLLLLFLPGFVLSQHFTGSYRVSAPEAGLFSLGPGYLNPAIRGGVLGIMDNPAALGGVEGRSLGLVIVLPQSSEGDFSLQATDSSAFFAPLVIDGRVRIEEQGGVGALGYAQKQGRFAWGIVLYQPRRAGFTMQARGDVTLKTHYILDRPLTREEFPDLPVEEIPVLWDIDGTVDLRLSSSSSEIALSVWPVMAAAAYRLGPLSLGAGLQYFRYGSGNKPAYLTSEITGTGVVSGTPYGEDPVTGLPWRGTFSADFSVSDRPLSAEYVIDLSGNRFALSTGFSFNLGPLSLGASYGRGFASVMRGGYLLTTIRTTGPPDLDRITEARVDWTLRPELSGHAALDFEDFEKDTVRYHDSGSLSFGGYQTFGAGIRFLFLGAFAGGQIPVRYPEFGSTHFGLYCDLPVPIIPVRFNLGLLVRTDGIWSSSKRITPYRVTTHLAGGTAVRLPLSRRLGIGRNPAWVRIGVRSSLMSLALSVVEDNIRDPERKRIPPIHKTLGLSVGIETPLEF
ncbi:MAG TPA: hypothetical protein ENN17_10855 [bacterium]|nr:hypothetical protein [bacterium]